MGIHKHIIHLGGNNIDIINVFINVKYVFLLNIHTQHNIIHFDIKKTCNKVNDIIIIRTKWEKHFKLIVICIHYLCIFC